MRIRVLRYAPWPFIPPAEGTAANNAAYELLGEITLSEATRLYWLARQFTIAITATITWNGDPPAPVSWPINVTGTLTRYDNRVGIGIGNMNNGDELLLMHDLTALNADINTDTATVLGYGFLGMPVSEPTKWTEYAGKLFPETAIPPDSALHTIRRRVTWLPINTDPGNATPALWFNAAANVIQSPAVSENRFRLLLSTYPQVAADPTDGDSGTFTGTILGASKTCYWRAHYADNLTGYDNSWWSVSGVGMTVTQTKWFAYKKSNPPHDGSDEESPVWNENTGAQILDPLTASVP